MGTHGPGRRRIPTRDRLSAEDDALSQIAREAEARLAAKRAARAEAREIRMKELERQQKEEDSERYSRPSRRLTSVSDDEEKMSVGSRGSLRPSDYGGFMGSSSRASSRASSARASPVVEERTERDFTDKGPRAASTLSAATLASLGGASSRRGSCDTTFSVETEASIREIKDSLAEAEERYRRAMLSNAQLHNEKAALMYQVDALKEELGDMEEELWEARRHCDDAAKELQSEHQSHLVLQFQFQEMKETLSQTEELLKEVAELRLRSSSYRQEVSDLQEALQWKEKKILALERQREMSDRVQVERDRLMDEVINLREMLQKHGVVTSSEFSTNGEEGWGNNDSRLVVESGQGSRESVLGTVGHHSAVEGVILRQGQLKSRIKNRKPQQYRGGQEATQRIRQDLDQLETRLTPPGCVETPFLTGHTTEYSLGAEFRAGIPAGGRVSIPQSRRLGCQDVAPVLRPLAEKVLKSRLAPPQPINDMILENMATTRLTSLNSFERVSTAHQDFHHQQRIGRECPAVGRGEQGLAETGDEDCSRKITVPEDEEDTAGGWETDENEGKVKEPATGAAVSSGSPKEEDHYVVSTAMSVHSELLTDRTILRDQVVVARIIQEIPEFLNQWIWDLKELLTKAAGSQMAAEDIEGRCSAAGRGSLGTGDPAQCEDHLDQTGNTRHSEQEVVESSPLKKSELRPELQTGSESDSFVFVESYFAEPETEDRRVGLSDTTNDTTEVNSQTSAQRQLLCRGPIHFIGPLKDTKEAQLKRHRATSLVLPPHHRSKVRRLIEMTAEELRMMAVPELTLIQLQEGRWTETSPGLNMEHMAEEIDSCGLCVSELRLKKVFEERESLEDQVRLLRSQLDQQLKTRTAQNPEEDGLENGTDSLVLDLQTDSNRQISDLKFKLVKSDSDFDSSHQVVRLEGQVTRYKLALEGAEKIEDELKVEKRRLQRELRSALDRVQELCVSNNHLSKRLEKMKANRNALLAQQ
ncbi:uncharacterized protein LOC115050778 [Echeneis naucrates]|uniref:uncharacterized protein LOC115050778 n=1 Tax=Echeneis naucrates TaxID=173247 RepID=UPI0011143C9E|nr:uncharacterized protein LOC115050778 [Echeneis naucrates]